MSGVGVVGVVEAVEGGLLVQEGQEGVEEAKRGPPGGNHGLPNEQIFKLQHGQKKTLLRPCVCHIIEHCPLVALKAAGVFVLLLLTAAPSRFLLLPTRL